MSSSGPWTSAEDEILLAHMLKHPLLLWPKHPPVLVPGRSSHACQVRWLTRLMRREPTADETEAFVAIYKGSSDPMWAGVLAAGWDCGSTPWAGLGRSKDVLVAGGRHYWYKVYRHKLWLPIALEIGIPWGVVESMFFALKEGERAEGGKDRRLVSFHGALLPEDVDRTTYIFE